MNARPHLRPLAPDYPPGSHEPPVVSLITSTKKEPATPLTLSLPAPLIKRARLLASASGVSLSKLVGQLLAAAIKNDLPALLADLTNEDATLTTEDGGAS